MPLKTKQLPSTSTEVAQLRLRIFAGPNGFGKSTVINSIRSIRVEGRPIDFGYYINADDIAQQLLKGTFTFQQFRIKVFNKEFEGIALASGLIGEGYSVNEFKSSYAFLGNKIRLKNKKSNERLAQVIADYLRKRLLAEKRKFSFETVFSHGS